jgi:FAD/FMN-containing dehydrogenase
MSSISLSQDSKTTSIGPGARWIQVYRYLDPKNLTVVGGHASKIGVSCLTLESGISYFSAQNGFACDNVNEYEVVLASGEIVTATPSRHSNLFRALRAAAPATSAS